MKRITLLVLGVLLGALSCSIVSARDDHGAYRVVFTIPVETALASARKKSGMEFWESRQLAKAVNQLAEQGYEPALVTSDKGQLIIIAKKR